MMQHFGAARSSESSTRVTKALAKLDVLAVHEEVVSEQLAA